MKKPAAGIYGLASESFLLAAFVGLCPLRALEVSWCRRVEGVLPVLLLRFIIKISTGKFVECSN